MSIIVPAYEAGNYLTECLQSLLSQTYSNVEIIVVYKRSSDNTEGLLKQYKDRIKIIEQTGTSPANARDVGIAHCKGQYVAFCDADDMFSLDKVKRQVNCFTLFSDVGVIYGDFFLIDSNGRLIDQITTPEWDFRKWLASGYIALSTLMVRKELLLQVNLFDETLTSNEDFDLLIRLARIAQFKRVAAYLSCRRIHKSNLSKSRFKTLFSRSKIYQSYGYRSLAISSFVKGFVVSTIFYFLVDHPQLYSLVRSIRGRRHSNR